MKRLTEFMGINESVDTREDWSFAGENTKYLTHGFHPYPARMMPLISKKVIETYAVKEDDIILDPFCGSGTVLVESLIHNKDAIGFDINPLAVLIAKAKTTPIEPKKLHEKINEVIRNILLDKSNHPEPESIPNLHYWFKPKVVSQLSKILYHIKNIDDEEMYNFFATAFSYTVWKVSNARKSEYKLYRMDVNELDKWNPDVLSIFKAILFDNLKGMEEFYKTMQEKKAKATIYLRDFRMSDVEDEVTIVLTSPPYGDSRTTVAYEQFSKYSALWLGFKEILNMEAKAIGGVRKVGKVEKLGSKTLEEVFKKVYEKDPERGWDLYTYFYDMDVSIQKIVKALKKGRSYVIFVIGSRTIRRIKIPTDRILIEMAEKHNLQYEKIIYRKIPSKRLPWKNAPENVPGIKGETIGSEFIIIWKY
ncbi:MAG: DNA methyltransferase [Thermoproteota archaeon]